MADLNKPTQIDAEKSNEVECYEATFDGEETSNGEHEEKVESSAVGTAVMALSGFAMVYSAKATAFCGDLIAIALRIIGAVFGFGELWSQGIGFILKTLTEQVIDSLLDELKSMFYGMFDTSAKVVGKTSDSINTTATTLETENIARELEIAPDHCISDEVAFNMRQSYYESNKVSTEKATSDTKEFILGDVNWTDLPKEKRYWRTDPSILESSAIAEGSSKEHMEAYDETTLGDLTDTRIKSADRNLDYETDILARKSRLSIIKLILDRQAKRKLITSDNLYSSSSLLDLSVQRTYGDEQWRTFASSYAAPTPLVKERCIELALSNHIKLNIHRQEEDILIANVIEILELLETPAYVENIYNLYEASNV